MTPEERQEVIRLLQASEELSPMAEQPAECLMTEMEDERSTAVDEAWVAEAERRFSAWKRKRTRALPAGKAIGNIRKETSSGRDKNC